MEYQAFCEALAQQACEKIMHYFADDFEIHEKSHSADLVTVADTEVNSFVIQEIRKAYPDHDILGEEESYIENGSEYVWICDPVDGTIPFSFGIPTMGFMLALVHQGRPVAAVIGLPATHEVYFAQKGCGAYKNGEQIHVDASPRHVHLAYIDWVTSPHRLQGAYDALTNQSINIVDFGSMALVGANTAQGGLSGVLFTGSTGHDSAAIDLLITEAGGVVSDLQGLTIDYRTPIHGTIAACNKELHSRLLETVQRARLV